MQNNQKSAYLFKTQKARKTKNAKGNQRAGSEDEKQKYSLGNGRIQSELLKLGIKLDRRTIASVIADCWNQGGVQKAMPWSKFV